MIMKTADGDITGQPVYKKMALTYILLEYYLSEEGARAGPLPYVSRFLAYRFLQNEWSAALTEADYRLLWSITFLISLKEIYL